MEPKKQFSQIGLMMLFATVLINGTQYISLIITKNIPSIAGNHDLIAFAGMLPCYFIAYPIILFLFKKIPTQLEGEPKKMRFSHLLIAFLMTYAITYISNFIGNTLITLLEQLKEAPVDNVLQEFLNQISPWTALIIAVILAPIFEELLFRKAVIDRTAKYGDGISMVFSGLLFGLFHGNFAQFAYSFFLGMFFGFIYLKTKNIMYPIILHILTNFMGSTVPMYVMDNSKYMEYEEKLIDLMNSPAYTDEAATALALEYASGITMLFAYLLVMFGMVVAGIILLIVKRKKFVRTPGEITIEKGQRLLTMCLNPGMIIFILFWIVMIVLQLLGIQ